MFAHRNMLSRTSSIFSLQTFIILETCFYPAAGEKAREKDVAVGCGTRCRTETQLALAADFSELHQDPRRKEK